MFTFCNCLAFIQLVLSALCDDDFGKTIVDIVKRKGYEIEEHVVTTSDGYIITQHRLINRTARSAEGPPVVFGVPLTGGSSVFVLQSRQNSMGFYCADRGFDVWLQNVRGNPYGRRHTTLNVDDTEFWNFSILEHTEDLRAQLDYTAQLTGYKRAYYVGVSQGSAIVLSLLSKRPEYNERFALLALFGAFRTTKNIARLNRLFAVSQRLSKLYGNGTRYGPNAFATNLMLDQVCKRTLELCYRIADLLNMSCVEKERIPIWLQHFPVGTSLKNLAYYIQLSEKDAPKEFDYGRKHNRRLYGNDTPPKLEAKYITAPIGLYFSHADTVTPYEEFTELRHDLRGVEYTYEIINQPNYGHMCYVGNLTNEQLFSNFTEEFRKRPILKG